MTWANPGRAQHLDPAAALDEEAAEQVLACGRHGAHVSEGVTDTRWRSKPLCEMQMRRGSARVLS